MQNTSMPRVEMLQVADAVAREKSIDKEIVLDAMQEAIQRAGRAKYGADHDIRAEINRKTGEISLRRFREVVEVVEDEQVQINHRDANTFEPGLELGQFLIEPLPPIDLGRIAAQSAKQVIVQKVRDAERERQFEEYKDRTNEIVTGIVKRVEYGNVTIDMGRAEGYMRRDEVIGRESHRIGDRLRCYIYDVRQEQRGPQIFLSRTHPMFMALLFAQEVPEIYDGVIEIKAVARDPGSRAKIAVISRDTSIDPVGACVGMRGSRVQAVVNELQGEKIDIIPWTQDLTAFVTSALAPATVTRINTDEENTRLEVVVPEDQLSLAIGRRGQNVRLASQLSGWDLDIMTEAEESEKRTKEFTERSQYFVQHLDVDDLIAQLLATEGYSSLAQIVEASEHELSNIEGFDEGIANELRERAVKGLEAEAVAMEEKLETLEVKSDIAELEIFDTETLIVLAEKGVKSRDDLADLAGDELQEMLPDYELSLDDANAVIMKAREHWFEDDPIEDQAAAEDDATEETPEASEETPHEKPEPEGAVES